MMKQLLMLLLINIIPTSIHSEYQREINIKQNFEEGWSRYNPLNNILENLAKKKPIDIFEFLRDPYPLPNGAKSALPEYDYVIVGAGSAGCVLASRLTENANVTVLLIEAGKSESIITDMPAIAPFFQRTDYAWPYYMEPQPGVCMGMINERCYWPRGKAIGGTSVINYMIYTRGRPEEWDRIAAEGNYGWSYKDVLEYYKKSEKNILDGYEDSPYRSRKGELHVEFTAIRTPLVEAFLEAGRILGSPTVDYNAPDKLGFGYVQTTTQSGKRHSAAKAFLHPNKNRPNLHILSSTTATKILIDKDTKNAYGVKYVRNRHEYEVWARKEVILSAGPIASPQLLMLSGIGPKHHLSNIGISVVKDLPVGRTLYDHIAFPGIVFTLNTTSSILEAKEIKLNSIFQWLQFDNSLASTPGGVEGIGYIKTPVSTDVEQIPDIELISIAGSIVSDGGPDGSKAVRRGVMITDKTFENAFGSIDNTHTWSALPMLLHPKSVGYLELKDKNPFSHPRMYGNYLTEPSDVATFISAIRYVQALGETKPFQKMGARLHQAKYSKCRQHVFNSEAYWECALRTLTVTLHHQIATCRMGPAGDPRAVVDPQLRVHGITNLRVVDSSVIPRTISAHTNAPAIMIGEKAADMIKNAWE